MKKNTTLKNILSFVLPSLIAFVVFYFLIAITVVQSGSMEPTLMTGDTTFYNRLAYNYNNISRGDIICFWSDELGVYLGKRVVGISGDEISFKDGYLMVNGQIVDEKDYINRKIKTSGQAVYKVPSGCVFVLGDNRENSYDSRFFENPYIPQEKIIGKYIGRIGFSFQFDVLNPLLGN